MHQIPPHGTCHAEIFEHIDRRLNNCQSSIFDHDHAPTLRPVLDQFHELSCPRKVLMAATAQVTRLFQVGACKAFYSSCRIMSPQSVKVLVADDHPAVCAGVRHALSQCPNINVACAPRSSGGMQQALDAAAYDVLVCEYAMLGGLSDNTAPCPQAIRQRYPGLRIVILTRLENAGVVHMLLSQGVQCIVSKVDELSHLPPAILRARGDRRYLSPRIETLAQAAGQPGGPVGADPARDGSDPAFPGRADGQRDRAAPGSQRRPSARRRVPPCSVGRAERYRAAALRHRRAWPTPDRARVACGVKDSSRQNVKPCQG